MVSLTPRVERLRTLGCRRRYRRRDTHVHGKVGEVARESMNPGALPRVGSLVREEIPGDRVGLDSG